uniref:Uncharacterized protein n=1 Tax=Anopheles melas TaxID=34690 RepID=A0A182TT87_9DIPT
MVFRLVVTPPSRLFSVFVIVDSVLVSSVPVAVPMLVTAVFSAFSVEETTLFTRFSIGRFVLIVPLPATPMLPRLRLPLSVPEVPEINEICVIWLCMLLWMMTELDWIAVLVTPIEMFSCWAAWLVS